ncbi:MAG: hypothetical protein P8Y69_17930 [Gammaproteobacteria bacterium]
MFGWKDDVERTRKLAYAISHPLKPYAWTDRGFAGDAVFATQAHVISHLRAGTPLENSGREYLRNLEIEDAIYRSSEEGRWIELSLH